MVSNNTVRVQNSFFWLRFWIIFWFSFLVPFALYLQQFGTRICHFAWYLLHFGMVTLHFACLLHFGMVTLHFAWHLHIWPCSPCILHAICHVLALQPLICMVFATFWYFKRSCGFLESFFRLSFRVSFRLSFSVSFRVLCRVSLGVHLEIHLRVSYQDFLSGFPNVHMGFFAASLGFHLGCNLGIL